jgi:putative acetyltransferase
MVEVWEASARATHNFVSEADMEEFKPLVFEELPQLDLAAVRDDKGEVVGFIGMSKEKLDTLFIHPDYRGKGIGKALVGYAIREKGATTVDVNEQNQQAVGFYQKMGFEVFDRSADDGNGKPYPLLHMRLINQNKK